MKYKAVIFDLDGVICHTDQYHYKAWKMIADELGIYFDEEKGIYTTKKNEQYKELLKDMGSSDLTVEVKETLEALRSNGLKLAIGSSSKNAEMILMQIGLEGYFDAISDGNHITYSKPNPEVFIKAAQYIEEEPQYCLVVEDAKAGIIAAKAGGMDCAAIGDGVLSGLATYNLTNLSDLLDIIGLEEKE